MGQTAAQTKREVDALRSEISEIVEELERRGRAMVDVRSRVADVRSNVSDHPATAALVAVGVAWTLGAVVVLAMRAAQRRRAEQTRLDRRAMEALEMLSERWPPARRGAEVAEMLRSRNGRREVRVGREPGLVRRLLWAGLTAALMALGSMLARRLSQSVWQRAMREQPPEKVAS